MSSINDGKRRTGSFADGQITVVRPVSESGRFCTGQERRHDAVDLREGGFADGQASQTVAVPFRGRFSSGQDRATSRTVGQTRTPPPLPAFAEGDG